MNAESLQVAMSWSFRYLSISYTNLIFEPRHTSSIVYRFPPFPHISIALSLSHLQNGQHGYHRWIQSVSHSRLHRCADLNAPQCRTAPYSFPLLLDYSSQDTTINRAELWAQWRRSEAHIKALRRCGFKLDTPRNLWEEVD